MNVLKKRKGFTLIELIVVIAIIGILAAVLIPSITGYIKTARVSADEQKAQAIYGVYQNYKTEVELDQTTMKFPDYYSEITGKKLEDEGIIVCVGNSSELIQVFPKKDGMSDFFGGGPLNVIEQITYFIYKGHYYTLINVENGDIQGGENNITELFGEGGA